MIKKAMVMAAGVGARLGALTQDIPKPLVPVLNMPVMDILLHKLKNYGIESVIANTHYLAEQIQNRYTNDSPVDINFSYVHENELSGTAGGVKKCEYFFEDEENFLVVSADGFHDADLARIIKSHFNHGCIATMAVVPVPMEEVPKYGVVVSSGDYLITEFQEKPPIEEAKSNSINTGIYVFNKRIFDYIPKDTTYDFAKNVFPALMEAGEKINTYLLHSYWSDIGTVDQYIQSTKDALNKKVSVPGVEIIENEQGKFVKGNNTIIDESVLIEGECSIGSNCKIGGNVTLNNAIIWDNVHIEDGLSIENSIVTHNCDVTSSLKNEIATNKVSENINNGEKL